MWFFSSVLLGRFKKLEIRYWLLEIALHQSSLACLKERDVSFSFSSFCRLTELIGCYAST